MTIGCEAFAKLCVFVVFTYRLNIVYFTSSHTNLYGGVFNKADINQFMQIAISIICNWIIYST